MILDIGSGDRPHPDATHLCDLYVEINTERGGDIKIDRPFITCSAEFLPFKENAFEFDYACHVLEHADDPSKAVAEITRVARRGYIETPTILAEFLYGWSFHKWSVHFENGKLAFGPKPSTQKFINMHRLYAKNIAVRYIDTIFDRLLGTHYLRIAWYKNGQVKYTKIRKLDKCDM